MKIRKYDGRIDITDWGFPDSDPAMRQAGKLNKAFEKLEHEMDEFKYTVMNSNIAVVSKIINEVFKRDGVYVDLEEGDKIAIGFPLAESENDFVFVRVRLNDLVEELMMQVLETECEDLLIKKAERCRDGLQAAVTKLASFIQRHKKTQE